MNYTMIFDSHIPYGMTKFNKDICPLKYLSFLSGPIFNTKNIYHPLFSNLEIFMLCNSTSVFLLQ